MENIQQPTLTSTSIIAALGYTPGYLGLPQNPKSADYTTVLSDSGKDIYHPVGDNNARTFTIASNASVAYPLETGIVFTNQAVANLSVVLSTDTLYFANSGIVTTITVPQFNYCVAIKKTATSWEISGTAGVTAA